MKIIYANPIFLDYRIPFYKRLSVLTNNEFGVLYSPRRYEGRFPNTLKKIEQELKGIAMPFYGDIVFNTKTCSFKKHSYYGRNIPFTKGLLRTIFKLKPKAVITEGFLGWTPLLVIYCLFSRTKLYIHYERTLHTERNVSLLMTMYRKIIDLFVNGYFINGTETKKYLLHLKINERKLHLAGMSADDSISSAISTMPGDDLSALRTSLKLKDGLTYLYVGRLSYAKGVDKLISAWLLHIHQYPNDSLLLIGDGELYEEYAQKYCDIQSIKILGRINYDQLFRYYAISDIFVIATLQDNWSLVVPEAMKCGLAVASSIYNGCATDLIVTDKNGYVFDPYNEEDFVETLSKFHNKNCHEMGKYSISIEEKFNVTNSSRRVFEIIKSYL